MQIGQLNQRITIQTPTSAADGQGGQIVTWSRLAKVWANVAPITGRESELVRSVSAALSTVVTIWYRTDLSVKDRIVLGTRTLEIDSWHDPTGFKDQLRLLCSEVQA